MKNTDPSEALSIEGIWIKLAADDYIDITLNDEDVPIGGTETTPINLNTASARKANGTFLNGADITGLSGGSIAQRLYHANSNGSVYINFNQDIVLGVNGVFSLYIGTGGVALEGMLPINFHGTNN
jgi:hypothetical protein